MNREPIIKTPRQFRAIQALLDNDTVNVRDMGPLIGALNARQVIHELRNQGFHDIILTNRFQTVDRDGRKCFPGTYFIPINLKPQVSGILKKTHRPGAFTLQGGPKSTLRCHNNGGA